MVPIRITPLICWALSDWLSFRCVFNRFRTFHSIRATYSICRIFAQQTPNYPYQHYNRMRCDLCGRCRRVEIKNTHRFALYVHNQTTQLSKNFRTFPYPVVRSVQTRALA